MVSTLDSESSDPSSSLGGTLVILCDSFKAKFEQDWFKLSKMFSKELNLN